MGYYCFFMSRMSRYSKFHWDTSDRVGGKSPSGPFTRFSQGKTGKNGKKLVKTQYAGKNLGKTIKIQGKCQATLKTCRVLPRFMMCY